MTKIEAKTPTQKKARALAVSYDAFNRADAAQNWSAIKVWGAMLIDDQCAVGFELIHTDLIRASIRQAEAATQAAA